MFVSNYNQKLTRKQIDNGVCNVWLHGEYVITFSYFSGYYHIELCVSNGDCTTRQVKENHRFKEYEPAANKFDEFIKQVVNS